MASKYYWNPPKSSSRFLKPVKNVLKLPESFCKCPNLLNTKENLSEDAKCLFYRYSKLFKNVFKLPENLRIVLEMPKASKQYETVLEGFNKLLQLSQEISEVSAKVLNLLRIF